MSRTYKASRHWLRNPRGHKQALIQGARDGAVPPDPWEDIVPDKQSQLAYTIAERMLEEGAGREFIVRHLMWKFKMDAPWARSIVKSSQLHLSWKYPKSKYKGSHERWLAAQKHRQEVAQAAAEHLLEHITRLGPRVRLEAKLLNWAAERGAYFTSALRTHPMDKFSWAIHGEKAQILFRS